VVGVEPCERVSAGVWTIEAGTKCRGLACVRDAVAGADDLDVETTGGDVALEGLDATQEGRAEVAQPLHHLPGWLVSSEAEDLAVGTPVRPRGRHGVPPNLGFVRGHSTSIVLKCVESGADAGLLERGGEDTAELARGGGVPVGRPGDAGAGEELLDPGSPEVAHGREGVLRLRVDDDRHVADGADLPLRQVTVGVTDGLDRVVLALPGESVEPSDEVGVGHEGPLAGGQDDRSLGLGESAGDDPSPHFTHPVVVARAVRELALAHAVRAVDGVDLSVAVALEELRPADAVGPADRVGRSIGAVLVGGPIDLAVVGVGPLTGGQTTGVTLGDGSH